MNTDAPTTTIAASDGTPITFRVRQAGADRPAFALVHSLAMDHRFWDPVADRLAGEATVITLDARGHGRSGRGAFPYTAERMARDVLEVADHLGIGRVVVGGASMGGCIALQFAGSWPERTAGLALVDTTAWYGPTAPRDWEERGMKAATQGLGALVEFQKSRWFSDAFRAREPALLQENIDIFLANDLDSYVATCRMMGSFDGRALLPAIQAPTAVLVGEEDYAAPVEMARALHAGIAGSTLQVIPGARHLTPQEVPDVVAASLLSLSRRR